MTLDDLPADERLPMTDLFYRLFVFADCVPECHACSAKIEVGQEFQLVSLEGTDEMLCGKCTKTKLKQANERRRREAAAWRRSMGGGYSRPSRGGA